MDDAAALRPLFIVTGASGSGKTAVFAPLARRLQGRGVPRRVAGGRHGAAQSGLATVLLGPFIPEHFDELPARHWIGDIHFIVLDCHDELRRTRINARPPWRSRDIDEQIEFGQWLRGHIAGRVDTSTGTPEEAAAAVAAWIEPQLT